MVHVVSQLDVVGADVTYTGASGPRSKHRKCRGPPCVARKPKGPRVDRAARKRPVRVFSAPMPTESFASAKGFTCRPSRSEGPSQRIEGPRVDRVAR